MAIVPIFEKLLHHMVKKQKTNAESSESWFLNQMAFNSE